MQLHYQTYLTKLKSCFTGKSVGGTLGMPLEGYIGTKTVTYYDPVPTQMIANDDLDLQVVWLEVLHNCGLPVNRFDLAGGWLSHMRGLCDEYGIVMRNLKTGLYPPLSGSYDNLCTAGMGSVIRTELWAALAPGDPDLAVKLALEDASCDHSGDGVDATAFMAALESYAYIESDIDVLLDRALSYLPPNGRVSAMLRDVRERYRNNPDPLALRKAILDDYFVMNWTDVGINLSFILIGLLDGEQEVLPTQKISRGLCTAVGLGHDADCTGATLGSIFGILYPNCFEERWTKPLGNQLVLSSCIAGMHEVSTIDALCVQIADACRSVTAYYHAAVILTDCPETWHPLPIRTASDKHISLYHGGYASGYSERESLVAVTPYTVHIVYPKQTAHAPGETLEYTVRLSNPNGKDVHAVMHVSASDGWSVSPDSHTVIGETVECSFNVTAPKQKKRRTCRNTLYLDFTTEEGFSFRVTAGLIETLPILHATALWDSLDCPPDALWQEGDSTLQQWHGHSTDMEDGGHLYVFETRTPSIITEGILNVQASRPIRVWRDGTLILHHDGTEYCPVFHRVENIARLSFHGEWNRYVVYVAPDVHKGAPDCPFTAYARVPDCPTPYEQRQLYDRSFGTYTRGALFIGFAQRTAYEWLHELEWRNPLP